jgi:aminopeptidase YwaD
MNGRLGGEGMNKLVALTTVGLLLGAALWGQRPPLLPEKDVSAIGQEISGETAKRNLEGIARFHRQRGSTGFHAAAQLVAEQLKAYGLSDVAILKFPADGKIFYGTQRSRPAWDAEFAELWEMNNAGALKLASFEAEPVVLAEDSESADVTADLVDVGEGTKESDYAGKDVKGKIVLASAQPGAVEDLAVGKFGVAGIVSYAQNQKTAWSGENQDAIRWGHLETFSANKTFGFMVSLKTAREMKEQLTKGEGVRLHAVVKAGQHPGYYEVVTATIPGRDARLKEEEIVFSCHLDHQRPGANDNASGCATILEVARTLQKLVNEEKLVKPARTIRFVFPPEIEGTLALLNGKPELAKRIKAAIHMDMVGGGPGTKAVFHVTRGPMSLPSFVPDIGWAFAEWVNEESYEYAATGTAAYPLASAEGGKEPLRAEYSAYSMGSDHDVYQDSSFAIPAIYLNDWPDRSIHTNFDAAAKIDPTKLKRAGFIGASSGYFLAQLNLDTAKGAFRAMASGRLLRANFSGLRAVELPESESSNVIQQYLNSESERFQSIQHMVPQSVTPSEFTLQRYFPINTLAERVEPAKPAAGDGLLIFRRNGQPKGPLTAFGYDYFKPEWAKRGQATMPKLVEYQGLWGGGEEYAYEVLNFADGKRNAQQIRDAVSAEYGPVPLNLVVEYLKALKEIAVVAEVNVPASEPQK